MATKRPTYSSESATSFLSGLATVTCGGGGALAAFEDLESSQPESGRAISASADRKAKRPRVRDNEKDRLMLRYPFAAMWT